MRKGCLEIVALLAAGMFLTGIQAGGARAADFAMIVKSGTVKLWDDEQRLDLQERRFDNHSRRTLAVAWEIRNAREVASGTDGEEENEFDFSGTGFMAGISLIF